MTEVTLVVHRGGARLCNDTTRDWTQPPTPGDRVPLDDASWYNGIAEVVYVAEDGRVWIYCGDYWGQVLDDRDVLYEGWGTCEVPSVFAADVYEHRVRRSWRSLAHSWERFDELCLRADPTRDDIARAGCENMRASLHDAMDHLRSLTTDIRS